MEHLEAKSYLVPYDPASRAVFWFNDEFPANAWSKLHSHSWGELAYTASGCMVVCTEQGNWLAPPQRAVWVPEGCLHEWYVPCNTKDCSLWIRAGALPAGGRFTRCHVMEITPLVRELLLHLARQPDPREDRISAHMVPLLLDMIPRMEEVARPVAMPRDHRLVELCTTLLNAPGTPVSQGQWARRLGMSERNLARLFYRETGTSFRSWRRRQRMQAAHNRLRQGESVTSVALDTGYSSVSAFIATFKHFFGYTPGIAARTHAGGKTEGDRQICPTENSFCRISASSASAKA